MNIVFFTHPVFSNHQSMPRFARMLSEGMSARGHSVSIWSPQPGLTKLASSGGLKKWLGYFDQYVLFPYKAKRWIQNCSDDTLFVFTDHALGPWVPLVSDRKHVIHCHDFLAQFSEMDRYPENPLTWTGKIYQRYIRRGYLAGKNFISVSKKTQADLHFFLGGGSRRSCVVYNGVNPLFKVKPVDEARRQLGEKIGIDVSSGYLLHVGGNQWYKNRRGIIKLYESWRKKYPGKLPLILIGENPDAELRDLFEQSPFKENIHFITGLSDSDVNNAYSGASLFLFPSLAEGFGWPIAEAMASGCPVITTRADPMMEVGGEAAFYISDVTANGNEAADAISAVLELNASSREAVRLAGLENVKKFDQESALDKVEEIYKTIMAER